MFKIKYHSILLLLIILSNDLSAQNSFSIVSGQEKASILIDKKDAKVVEIAADILARDIHHISNKTIEINTVGKFSIIAGTLGKSKWIDGLVSKQKIDISQVKGKWETYKIEVVENPFKGIEKALVIVGSDRRATAYGLLEVSRMLNVSPWEWWADVTPDKKEELILSIHTKIYGEPSVKYRGVFLNDEDWGLQRWAALNYEPETGDMGPKTYAKVFELLLRLRANTIWPAMHRSTKPFYSYPENKQVADDYAIVIGTSHAEPMLSNINTEWNHETMGEYRYDTNSEVIKNLFKKRVKETAKFENIYTTGMRGEHDSPMIVGEDDTDQQVKLLEKIITDQRAILKQETKKNPNTIPQAFVPYKEVLTYYQNGLNLPEDITLVWTDDNYGYIRQLSTPDEQKRKGGAGVYYHTSYWGRPHDYLWLNSTNPVLMWEEMSKAYEFKSRDLWILNCGDIKPHEYNIELFLDMAWDMKPFEKSVSVKEHMKTWATREFGAHIASETTNLLFENNRLSYIRRPEFMAWSEVEPVTKAGETTLTQYHYGDEVTCKINAYEIIVETAERLYKKVPENRKAAFYQLVYYPVIGASKLSEKWLYFYKNKFVSQQGKLSANFYSEQSENAYNRILKETDYYNKTLAEGKWNHIMTMQPRFLPVFSKPAYAVVGSKEKPTLGIALEGYEMEVNHDIVNSFADVLPVFNSYTDNHYFMDIFLKGEGKVEWKAIPKSDWIKISETEGILTNVNSKQEKRLWVSIDWDKVPTGENKKEAPLGHDFQLIPPSYKVNSAIDFVSADSTVTIGVSVFNPKLKVLEGYKGFIEDKGFVSIHAENPTRNITGKEAKWEIYDGMGYTGKVIAALPRSTSSITDLNLIQKNSPSLEYDFYTFNFGEVDLNLQAVPTHAIHEGRGVRCAVSIDDAEPVLVDFQTFGRSDTWKQNVLKNASVQSVKQIVNKAGKHTLKVWMVDSGVMLDQILIDLGGWKKSYAFPSETKKRN
ncbi:glycosyl hydrolase 115 family protein [Mariniflexile litorale]|uniref:Glycosyl hydrolase 115 family protein n=1 Tax=Mariniflexile litorale TaxID=3045158 RepID=A0AAU7EEU4_9FLAO|nr:glycosyl hydrolase 115 family protein [Mariniflexile sp. KMM 9835]MDQ8210880.1 glycosyl hydrolase 115 family protein [Mariniflexile sp. KMM 9835]